MIFGALLTQTQRNLRGEINHLKYNAAFTFFLISKNLNDSTNNCKILYAPETDHSAILIHVKSDELKHEKGPGFWKFNQSLLKDETYVINLRAEIPNFNKNMMKLRT